MDTRSEIDNDDDDIQSTLLYRRRPVVTPQELYVCIL